MSPRVPRHVAWEALDDGSLMLCHLPTGAMIELSAPAGLLWHALLTDGDVAGTLMRQLAVDPGAAQAQAQAFVELLRERDLLPD